ncbi:RNA-directed DNA polymerase, eukaryota, reverse transcriptase zinc-binding domain protein [Tanacetum coccineum]
MGKLTRFSMGVNEMVDTQQSDDENSTDGGDKESSGEFDAVSGENIHDTNDVNVTGIFPFKNTTNGFRSPIPDIVGCSEDGSKSTFAEVKDKDSNIVSDKAPDNNLGCIRTGSTSKGILRCNTRILSQPTASNNSESNEVNNTINVGNLVGFAMNEDHKKSWVKRLCIENKVKFVGLQETMSRDDNKFLIQSLWKNSKFAYFTKKADGKSGGIIAIWDPSFFSSSSAIEGDGFVAITGKWRDFDTTCLMIVVYAPQDHKRKEKLWRELNQIINQQNIPSIVFGDFNEVRNASERLGSIFDATGASMFNKFIFTSGLCDLPMGVKLRGKLDDHDNKAEEGPLTPTDATARIDIVREPTSLECLKVMDLRKKSKHILVEDYNILYRTITPQEIKDAIWDCGGDKASGPNGFTFKFIKKHWEIIKDDIIAYVKEFENTTYIPRGCNSSFITLIPKIDDPLTIGEFRPISLIGCQYKIIAKILANRLSLVIPSVIGEVQMAYIKGRQIIDGPLIVDEIISWAKKYKKRLMFLKVDFEKAFDSLNWSFLFSIMEQMGFSRKWRTWISSCLKSAFASVLINGSPTKEFKVEKGLRQGDPLSPFLFIIAIEALNVALLNACNNTFHGVKCSIRGSLMSLSFGGRFTLIKSVLGSLGVYYFSTFKAPNKIINKLEGIRRIFFWGGTTDENKIAWIAWDKATSSISNGGLGIGTLKSSNHAMLSKWWWRFHTENHAFWCMIIRSIHGVDGGLNDTSLIKSKSGPWYRIAKLKDDLSKIGIDLPSIFKKKIGDGCSTRFWLDTWLGGSP